ncbi:ABC transporter permease [Actinomycetaceae bacterium WB03_NA08]|uniref:Transport permease protein n=1 Tax=Scrofimicrobium canadense TaxID=2652290 RepID=A0A6N7W7P0_9ACTO|nr:ABC transporter permease [Scrofimicrobium canadense]MSS85401.1 ABC transporter permease [Scrofimicrobium canadense]
MSIDKTQFDTPGRSSGLLEVFRRNYLESLLVHKELRVRYRGSVLGMLWSYAKPLTQFAVFYVAVGLFMGMERNISHFVLYMFAGVVLINYFTEAFSNATRSVVVNAALVKKIYLPRQLFPVSSIWVALVHLGPQLVVLLVAALIFGWRPGLMNLAAIVLAVIIVTVFALGVGLMFAAANVFFRDAENFVELILMMATWISPILYSWTMVYKVFVDHGLTWIWTIYQLNPMTVAVELFHYGFWQPTISPEEILVHGQAGFANFSPAEIGEMNAAQAGSFPPNAYLWVALAFVISFIVLFVGDWVFRRAERRFAQEL